MIMIITCIYSRRFTEKIQIQAVRANTHQEREKLKTNTGKHRKNTGHEIQETKNTIGQTVRMEDIPNSDKSFS